MCSVLSKMRQRIIHCNGFVRVAVFVSFSLFILLFSVLLMFILLLCNFGSPLSYLLSSDTVVIRVQMERTIDSAHYDDNIHDHCKLQNKIENAMNRIARCQIYISIDRLNALVEFVSNKLCVCVREFEVYKVQLNKLDQCLQIEIFNDVNYSM